MTKEQLIQETRKAMAEFRRLPHEEQVRRMIARGTINEKGEVLMGRTESDEFPPDSMPEPLKTFAADINPISMWVDSLRHLFVGTPIDNQLWIGLIWAVGIVVIFAPLAVWRYRRVAMR